MKARQITNKYNEVINKFVFEDIEEYSAFIDSLELMQAEINDQELNSFIKKTEKNFVSVDSTERNKPTVSYNAYDMFSFMIFPYIVAKLQEKTKLI